MTVGIVGLGYVGLPLAIAFGEAGHDVIGVDIDARLVSDLGEGRSHIEDVPDEQLASIGERFRPTMRYGDLVGAEAIVVCVPTSLSRNREPDLESLCSAARAIERVLR